MHVIIYVASILIVTLINVIIGLFTGYRAGHLVLYLVCFFIARKLCQKYDDAHEQRAARREILAEMKNSSSQSNEAVTPDQNKETTDEVENQDDSQAID